MPTIKCVQRVLYYNWIRFYAELNLAVTQKCWLSVFGLLWRNRFQNFLIKGVMTIIFFSPRSKFSNNWWYKCNWLWMLKKFHFVNLRFYSRFTSLTLINTSSWLFRFFFMNYIFVESGIIAYIGFDSFLFCHFKNKRKSFYHSQ